MTTTTEIPLLEAIRKCSPGAKKTILVELLREQVVERADGNPFAIEDETGLQLGSFVPALKGSAGPLPITAEQRLRYQGAIATPENSFTVDEMLAKYDADELLSPRKFLELVQTNPELLPSAPPPMTSEERAELLRRVEDRENALTLDELLATMNLEDSGQNSKSQS